MAFSMNGGTGRGRGRFHGSSTLSEINIVPLVDVVLVLLIIFMLTAHVMEFGLEVDVPKVKQSRDSAEVLPVITVSQSGEMSLNENPININRMAEELRAKFPGQKAVYVRADKETTWDALAQGVAQLGEAKFDVRMVTQPEDTSSRRR